MKYFFQCLLFLGALPSRIDAAWILTIPPYEEECFLVRTPSAMKTTKLLTGDFELIEDNNGVNADPLLVYVMEATREEKILWRSSPGAARGAFKVTVSGNKGYWICLQNSSHAPDNEEEEQEHPDHVTRQVGLTFKVKQIHEKPAPLVFSPNNSDEWMAKSAEVTSELQTLVNHQDYMRVRESIHRSIVEATFTATMVWTLIEAGMVTLVAAGQVFYLRRFLENKRYM
jgi:hypothetical protein